MLLTGIMHPCTIRRHIKDGKIHPPDFRASAKTYYWHRATLEKVGIIQAQPNNQSA